MPQMRYSSRGRSSPEATQVFHHAAPFAQGHGIVAEAAVEGRPKSGTTIAPLSGMRHQNAEQVRWTKPAIAQDCIDGAVQPLAAHDRSKVEHSPRWLVFFVGPGGGVGVEFRCVVSCRGEVRVVTMGVSECQAGLFGGTGFVGDRVEPGSVFALLFREGGRLFPDSMFADLFCGRGRRSVAPRTVATVMVLQRWFGLSDREAVAAFEFDVRWRYACGGLGLDSGGFCHTVLVGMRARLAASESPRRIFDVVLDAARAAGAVSPRRVLDSAPVYDAVATQDTVTMLRSAIRQTLAAADAAGFGRGCGRCCAETTTTPRAARLCATGRTPRRARRWWQSSPRMPRRCLRRCGAGLSAPTRPTRPSCWPPFRARTSRRAPTTRCASAPRR